MVSRIVSLAPASMGRHASEVPDFVSWAAQAGFTHVGLRIVLGAFAADNPMLPGRPMMRETQARLRGEGISATEIEVVRLDAAAQPLQLQSALESAALLGCKNLVVICDDPDMSRTVDNFAQLCEVCARFSLTANIEPTSYYVVDSIAKARRIVERAGRQNGGVIPDPLHFFRAHDSLDDLESLGHWLKVTQLCDGGPADSPSAEDRMAEARGERLPPGEGSLDLAQYLRAVDPALPVSVEVPMTRFTEDQGPAAAALRLMRATTAFFEGLN